jgi:hypothetical protein
MEKNDKRDCRFELLRVIAAAMIILNHIVVDSSEQVFGGGTA